MSIKKANENNISVRKDMRIDKELLAKVDAARGDVPFAAWVKRAILMRLDGETSAQVQTKTHKPTQSQPSAVKGAQVVSANEKRAAEIQATIKTRASALSDDKKAHILGARYPKNEFRKAIDNAVSKDSIAKYWDMILDLLRLDK